MTTLLPPGVVEVDAVAEEGRSPDARAHAQRPASQRGRRQRRKSHLALARTLPLPGFRTVFPGDSRRSEYSKSVAKSVKYFSVSLSISLSLSL